MVNNPIPIECRKVFYVSGERLLVRMTELGLEEASLASKANVSEQTIRNYLSSTLNQPWTANSKSYERVCVALEVDPTDLRLEMVPPASPNHDRAVLADQRFLGDPQTVRSIAGHWNASSIDLEIPGFVSYKNPIPWHGQVLIEQFGNRFDASGVDKDGDDVIASGVLLEDGNFMRFDYWIDNSALRQYGTSMVEFKGDGRTIEGIFVGRDAGHSNIGLVIAKLTLTRVETKSQK